MTSSRDGKESKVRFARSRNKAERQSFKEGIAALDGILPPVFGEEKSQDLVHIEIQSNLPVRVKNSRSF